jgi:hypothetical protein
MADDQLDQHCTVCAANSVQHVTVLTAIGYRMLNFNNFSFRGGSNGAHEKAVNGKGYCLLITVLW